MISKYVATYILSVMISSFSQVLLKKSANQNHKTIVSEYLNLYVIIGYILFVGAVFLTIYAYREVPLKSGPIINSFGYVFVLILGKIFLNEEITKNKIQGNILIIIGIIIFSL